MQLSKTQIIALFLASNASAQIAEGSRGFKWNTANSSSSDTSTGFTGLTFANDGTITGKFETGGVKNCENDGVRTSDLESNADISLGKYTAAGTALTLPADWVDHNAAANF